MSDLGEQKSNRHYSLPAKLFHWGFVIIFAYGVLKQVNNINQLEDLALLRFEIIFASIFIALLILRYIYMEKTQTTSLPANTSKIQKTAAKSVHYAMYIALLLIALSGLFIGLLYWMGTKSGFMIDMMVALHEFSVTAIYWLIAIHLIGALYHRILVDGVWSSMVPIWKEKISEPIKCDNAQR